MLWLSCHDRADPTGRARRVSQPLKKSDTSKQATLLATPKFCFSNVNGSPSFEVTIPPGSGFLHKTVALGLCSKPWYGRVWTVSWPRKRERRDEEYFKFCDSLLTRKQGSRSSTNDNHHTCSIMSFDSSSFSSTERIALVISSSVIFNLESRIPQFWNNKN